jgi:hypothetical protein
MARNVAAAPTASTRTVARHPIPSTSAAVTGKKIGLENAPMTVSHTTARSGSLTAARIAAGWVML